jgi:hypothetical protein
MWHEWGKEKCSHYFDGEPETSHVTGLGVGGIIILKMRLEGIE